MVICEPDIEEKDLDENDEFFVIGCDGIWELQTGDGVCQTVVDKLKEGVKKLSTICETILDKGLAPSTQEMGGLGCDNMSVLIVQIAKK